MSSPLLHQYTSGEIEARMNVALDLLRKSQEACRRAYDQVAMVSWAFQPWEDGTGDAIIARKLGHIADAIDTQTAELGRRIDQVAGTFIPDYVPGCPCGMSSRCTLPH